MQDSVNYVLIVFMAVIIVIVLWNSFRLSAVPERLFSGQHDVIRKVIVCYEGVGAHEYMVLASEFARFKEACLKLHYDPGINPYSKETTSSMLSFESFRLKLKADGSVWWTSPDLLENDSSKGARIFEWEKVESECWYRPPQKQSTLSAA